VGRMQLNAVIAGPGGPASRGDESADELADPGGRQFPGRGSGNGIRNGGGGQGSAADEPRFGLTAGVGQLGENSGGKGMDGIGDPGQARDEGVVENRKLAGRRLAGRMDEGVAGDDEADVSGGEPAVEVHLSIRDHPVFGGHIIVGGRTDETVGDGDGSDAKRSPAWGRARRIDHGRILYKKRDLIQRRGDRRRDSPA